MRRGLALSALSAPLCALLISSSAHAHGVWGHVHVTGWAIENLPPGELKDFFANDEVRQAAQFGAAFTDSGYSIEQRKVIPIPFIGATDEEIRLGHDYSEHTHWEPFIEGMIQWIRRNDPPPWTSVESQKRVAFVMGAAAHGLQDEIFDSLFLYQAMKYDGQDQNAADPATDYLLNEQGYLRFAPPKYAPMEAVREVYHELGFDVEEAIINKGMETVGDFYLNSTYRLIFTTVISNGDGNPNNVPWVKAHYLDPDVPGSLVAEIVPTASHMMGLWKRLHGELAADHVVVATYPARQRRLRSHLSDTPDAWVALIFGQGVKLDTANGQWTDSAGAGVPFNRVGTRWGAEYPRLIRLQPTANLVPGGWYDAGMLEGATLIGGERISGQPFSFEFQVACTAEDTSACMDLGGPIPVPSLDGSGPPPGLWPEEPTMPGDPDAGVGDGSSGDGSSGDGASGDGSSGDGSSGDGSSGDGADGTDGATGDGSSDGSAGDGSGDSAPGAGTSDGGCSVGHTSSGAGAFTLLAGLGAFWRRRRRGR